MSRDGFLLRPIYVVKVKNNFWDDFDNFSKNIVLRHFGSKVDREKLHIILSTIFIRENYNYFLYLKNINRLNSGRFYGFLILSWKKAIWGQSHKQGEYYLY